MFCMDIRFMFDMNSDLGNELPKMYRNTFIMASWMLTYWYSDL